MNLNEILTILYKQGIVQQIIRNIAHGLESDENMQDLVQDIFLILLEKPPELIIELYAKGELSYYIANIVYTQLRSQTSPYYTKYKKFKNITTTDENIEKYL